MFHVKFYSFPSKNLTRISMDLPFIKLLTLPVHIYSRASITRTSVNRNAQLTNTPTPFLIHLECKIKDISGISDTSSKRTRSCDE